MRISAVSRTPAASGPPALIEVDGLVGPSEITLTETLNEPGSLQFTLAPSKQASAVLTRFFDLSAYATEIWLWDDEAVAPMFAGPLLGYGPKLSGDEITWTVTAAGLLDYLRRWRIEPDGPDLNFVAVDQANIAVALIDYWQDLPYGDFGIDTTSVTPTGVTRDRTYAALEAHLIAQRISELAASADGFDFQIDPSTREFVVHYPYRGDDLSASVTIDGRSIVDPSAQISAGPEDLVTDTYGVGDEGLVSHAFSPSLRSLIGRQGFASSFSGVTEQATLDDHTQGMLNARSTHLHIPADSLFPIGLEWGGFAVGDVVEFAYDYGAGMMVEYRRIQSRVLNVKGGGTTIQVGFM